MKELRELVSHLKKHGRVIWRWILVIGVLTTVSFVGLVSWRVYRSLTNRSWGEVEAFRMLIVGLDEEGGLERIVTLHYLPDLEELVYLELPNNTKISAGAYGDYTLRGLYRLDEVEKAKGDLLHEAVERELGVLLPQRMLVRGVVDFDRLLEKPRRMGWRMLERGVAGEQNILDAFELWREWRSLGEAQVTYVSLDESRALERVTAIDGVEEWQVNRLRMDDLVKRRVMPSVPELAEIGVVVENATGKSGLAGNWSRFVVSEGFDLLNVTDASSKQKQSSLLFETEQARDSFGGEHLRRIFPHFLVAVTDLSEYRSEAVLRLGEDVVF